ncbi:MAG: hypothetical protein M3R23_03515, partial [Actinomycetota bacterium]|nr:hypothetical protein [Actinomycetota bacterium]
VREHADELRSLPAFGPACSAIDAAGIAAPYLEARGEAVPEDEVERADQMLVAFIARLWDGSAEFRLDKPRLDAALHELEAEARDVSEAEVLLAPLVGLQTPLARLELPSGVQIVRADTVDAPAEATGSDGMQRSAWEPQFLAFAEKEEGVAGAAPAMRMLRELISVLRLFKEGGVGLGPYAHTPTGEGTWRRIATGVPSTRLGGYKLSEAEATELADFARCLEARPDPGGALAWAVARFEMGCDRPTALEGLSDHLLAMRALFEGNGPVGASLPMRAAALIAEPPERAEACEKLQAAFELERAMMSSRKFDFGSAMGLAAWLEDAARSIVRGAALGEHGSDVAASADESLVASGLEAGEGSVEQMGEVDEWSPPTSEESAEQAPDEVTVPDPDSIRIRAARAQDVEGDSEEHEPAEQVPERDGAYEDGIYYEGDEDADGYDDEADDGPDDDHDYEETTVSTTTERDWLSEVSGADSETLEWPAVRARSPQGAEGRTEAEDEEPLDEPRVRHLFPVPDNTDWEIGELDYDRDKTRVS